jgi:hypothetical protein
VVGDATTGQLKKITLNQISALFGSSGTVSSVAMTVPTGLTVTGSPITTSGTLALTFAAGYSLSTTAKQTEWDTAYTDRLKWDGSSSGLNAPTARTSLGLVIGTDVLAYRTFGSAANNNTGDFATAAQGTNADTAYSLRLTGASTPLSISGNIISISQANTSTNGFLTSTNWNTFNNKIGGSGTAGKIPVFTDTNVIGNSTITEAEGGVYIDNYLFSGLPYFSYNNALAASFRITSNTNGNQVKLAFGTVSGIQNYSNIVTTIVDNSADTKGRLDFQVRSGNNSYATPLSLAYTGAATFESSVTATSFIKSGGTSSQFLKADGSVDTNAYITSITSGNVTTALGYTPYNATNPSGYISSITSSNVTTALGYTPYNATNPAGYITGITSSNVTTALGYTPYNSSNPAGYITSSSLGSYLPLSGGTLSGNLIINGSSNLPLKITATEPVLEIRANGATNVAILAMYPSTGYDAAIGNFNGGALNAMANSVRVGQFRNTTVDFGGSKDLRMGTAENAANQGSISLYGSNSGNGYEGRLINLNSDGNTHFLHRNNNANFTDIGYWNDYGIYIAYYGSYSDIRLKNVIETNPNINLDGIDVIKYTLKSNPNLVRYGYSAQQVQSVLPDLVTLNKQIDGNNEDATLMLNYNDLYVLKIAALEKRILELENKLK